MSGFATRFAAPGPEHAGLGLLRGAREEHLGGMDVAVVIVL
jgi:hypothetical protein